MRVFSYKNQKTKNKNTTILDRRFAFSGEKAKKTAISTISGSARISLMSLVFVVFGLILFSGAFYLYQVNDTATKGVEIKKAESQINDLKQSNENLKIKEVELRSMYNIEREVKNMDLVNTEEISYVEVKGPVAMR